MEFEKLRDIIVEVLNVDETEVTMESTFIDDLVNSQAMALKMI